jgi:inhibitor of the pro-sigma K processing machinery
MISLWWVLFIVSLSLLIVTLLRNKYSIQWLGSVGINIVVSAIVLYVINWVGAGFSFHIPLNVSTLATVGVFGVPGIALLAALKLTVL